MRKYKFNWSLLGDIAEGRPNLGTHVGVDVYRLMQFTLRDILEEKLGSDETDKLFFEAGKLAGKEFYKGFIHPVNSMDEFVSKVQKVLKEKNIGILRIEDNNNEKVMLTVDEDLDCSGMPEIDYETCIYDEGFISALFDCFTGKDWTAKEIDCWCTGSRTCRFVVSENNKDIV